ncbi:ACP phosphodiesterase [Thalassomonas sp. M1454]|uniref:acyl carrier protein phosphodiesterase n=1 Tax=Thalassomonas sp. M1454 TaxID=2594477 RepID=UPI00117EFD71|nr:ACP phosphodiesterase [Thalassomonas sp. M1454]TRX55849.1 DUF479 domain-containing protein [Thalassomonas sp. M1454]
MNYLAHLFFAQDTALSLTGNLMGDFTKGVDLKKLPLEIYKGVENHRLVDKFTDQHDLVRSLKLPLSVERKRFSFIISDVVFDHFLAIHWHKFSELNFDEFVETSYQKLLQAQHHMPERMQFVVQRMASQNWLSSYKSIDVTGQAIDSLSKRIRFKNNLAGAIVEVKANYDEYEHVFLEFFPQLQDHVEQSKVEMI